MIRATILLCAAWLPVACVAQVVIKPEHGFHREPFEATLEAIGGTGRILYTTNGAVPTPTNGKLYERPIPIRKTTVLRAAVIPADATHPQVETRTYIFPKDVLKQTGVGFPATWGFNDGKPVPGDYEMDPDVVNDANYHERMEEGLRAIPSVSVVAERDDWFDAKRGIYANPKESGSEWERPASLEFLPSDGRAGFQINCGVRIQGGWNRRPEESPKHSLRLVFKKKYSAPTLRYPVFGDVAPVAFDTLILRGGCNNTWLHWSGEERRRGDYLRDQWMRDTQLAMGHPAARGRFVHLYLNGLYWGLYNLCERPGPAFAAAHFGGTKEDYDARNGDHVLSGDDQIWKKMMSLANAGLTNDTSFQAIQQYLALPNFIDYMIANFYGANADWDRSSNWYAARRRVPGGKYHFLVWDGERTLEAVEDNTIAFDDDESPPRLFHKLRENSEFCVMFADLVHKHLLNRGALTPAAAAGRYRTRANEIETAVVAESARWGDYRRDVHSYKTGPYERYTANEHWKPEINRLLGDYFPRRTKAVLEQFRALDLYPRVDAPTIGVSGKQIVVSASAGRIFLTTDGSDPRLPGGDLSSRAIAYEHPVESQPGVSIKARALVGQAGVGKWSALAEQGDF